MTNLVLVRRKGPIGHLIFNNPEKLNGLSLGMWEGMSDGLAELEADPSIRVIALSGAGGAAFVAGADTSKYEDERMSDEAQHHYTCVGEDALSALYGSTKVTVAAIDGWCIGGGISIITACDLRYCSEKSVFGQPVMRYGMGYRYQSLRRLVDIVGIAAAKEMLLSGLQFSALEAHQSGLVSRVVPNKHFGSFLERTLQGIAAGAPLTVRQIKFTLDNIVKDPDDRDVARCEAMFQACHSSADHREAVLAFKEKRKPVFAGR